MKLLVNNVEQNQSYDGELTIHLYGRTGENPNRCVEVTVHGFRPYFYAPEEQVEEEENFILGTDSVVEVQYGDYQALGGTPLARVYTPTPQDVHEAKHLFDETWEADVPFTDRFRIDSGMRAYVEVPDTECHWQEVVTLRPPGSLSSDDNPEGSSGEMGGADD